MTPPLSEDLVDVDFVMLDGKRYSIPDVEWSLLWHFLRNESLESFPQLALVNKHRACLYIPTAALKHIVVNGETHWSRP